MVKAMLGSAPLSVWRGLRDDLEDKVAGRNGNEWLSELKKFLRKEGTWEGESEFPLVVDYELTTEEHIARSRRYRMVDLYDAHLGHGPYRGHEKLVIKLFNFDVFLDTLAVKRELDRRGYRPINLFELVAFAREYRYPAGYGVNGRSCNIVALNDQLLGEPRGQEVAVPLLSLYSNGERELFGLRSYKEDGSPNSWPPDTLFAAVKLSR